MSSPSYIHQITSTEVLAAIDMAERVVAWAESVLNPPPTLSGVTSN
jgi:hypothetical protein